MNLQLSPDGSAVFAALKTFLELILPSGDAVFEGTISGDQMTVGRVYKGAISVGDAVLGQFVSSGTVIASIDEDVATISPSQGMALPPTVLSTGIEIIQAQENRVPEPIAADYVTMNSNTWMRLGTNFDSDADCVFRATISGTTMTIVPAPENYGLIRIGAIVWGVGVAPGTRVTKLVSPGVYSVAPAQNVVETTMAAGAKSMVQSSKAIIQLGIHGPNSSDTAQAITTAFRDEFATQAFAEINPAISPLYVGDPRQIPFINGEQQYEDRWVADVHLQVNQAMLVPQQYADAIDVMLINVETIPLS